MTFTFFSSRRLTAMLALSAVIALLPACGQKGPLTLPGKEGSDAHQSQDVDAGSQASPANAAPAATAATPADVPTTTAPATSTAPATTAPTTTE